MTFFIDLPRTEGADTCFECEKQPGLMPAILDPDGKVLWVCKQDWQFNWRGWMHAPTCNCPHCEKHSSYRKV